METKTFELSFEVLKRLQEAGILKSVILIGSWCIYFYQYYFNSPTYSSAIRTLDMDILVPLPPRFEKEVNFFSLIEDLGYVRDFRRIDGYVKFVHPDLTIEFLIPEHGRSSGKPYNIRQLGINAQPLRYLDFLAAHTISLKVEELSIIVPHPAAYALHKFIIFKRRRKDDKEERDLEGAIRVFNELIKNNKQVEIKRVFSGMHKKWQKTVIQNLKSVKEDDVADLLGS